MSTIRCTRRGCGSTLVERLDKTIGRLSFACEPCERNARGLCRDCPAPLTTPRHMRCEPCATRRRREVWRQVSRKQRADAKKYDRIKAQRRRRYRSDPAVRAKAIADNKARRAAAPRKRDDLDRLYHRLKAREYRAKHPERTRAQSARNKERYHADPAFRESVLAAQRARRKQQTPEQRARDNARRRQNLARQRAEAV